MVKYSLGHMATVQVIATFQLTRLHLQVDEARRWNNDHWKKLVGRVHPAEVGSEFAIRVKACSH